MFIYIHKDGDKIPLEVNSDAEVYAQIAIHGASNVSLETGQTCAEFDAEHQARTAQEAELDAEVAAAAQKLLDDAAKVEADKKALADAEEKAKADAHHQE